MPLTEEQQLRKDSANLAYKAQFVREMVALAEDLRKTFYEGQGALTYWIQKGYGSQAPNEITENDLADADMPFTPAELQTLMGTLDAILTAAETNNWIAPVSTIARYKR